jgi:hypothetical protein
MSLTSWLSWSRGCGRVKRNEIHLFNRRNPNPKVVMGVRLRFLGIAVIIIAALLSGCIEPPYGYWVNYSYQMDVYSENQTLQYQIFLPFPVNGTNETLPGFLDNMEDLRGAFETGMNQTTNGISLAVNGTGNVRFEINFDNHSDDPIEPYFNLSMQDDYWPEEEIGFFWVFCSADNISIHLFFEYSYDAPDYVFETLEYEIITTLQIGWQRVPAVVRDFGTM